MAAGDKVNNKRLKATLVVEDKATASIQKVLKDVKALERSFHKLNTAISNMDRQMMRLKFNATSKGLQSLSKSMEQADKTATKLDKSTEKLNKTKTVKLKLIDQVTAPLKSVQKMLDTVLSTRNLVLGGGAMYAGNQFIQGTVGQSLEYDYDRATLQYVGKKRGLDTNTIQKNLEKQSLESMLDTKEMVNSAANLSSFVKNADQMDKAMKLMETLAYTDPMQGAKGATFAMQEIFSGSARSLYARFEKIPKQVANKLTDYVENNDITSEKGLDGLLDLFQKELDSVGFGSDYVNSMNQTGLAQWYKAKEAGNKVLIKMGESILPQVNDGLKKFSDYMEDTGIDKFSKALSSLMKPLATVGKTLLDTFLSNDDKIASFFSSVGQSISNFLTYLGSVFKGVGKDKTFGDALLQLLDDGVTAMSNWIDNNQDTIGQVSKSVIGTIAKGVNDNIDVIIEIGIVIGKEIAVGVVSGFLSNFSPDSIIDGIKGGIGNVLGVNLDWWKTGKATQTYKEKKAASQAANTAKVREQEAREAAIQASPWSKSQRRAIGGTIQRDNTPTLLHEGEIVIPKRDVLSGKAEGKGITNNINFQGIVREEADIQKIVKGLVRELQMAGGLV